MNRVNWNSQYCYMDYSLHIISKYLSRLIHSITILPKLLQCKLKPFWNTLTETTFVIVKIFIQEIPKNIYNFKQTGKTKF